MTLIKGYEYKEDVAKHPLGLISRVVKDEYDIHFKRCIISGELDEILKSQLKLLRYNSYIVSYEGFEKGKVILEDIYPLKKTMTSIEIKKLIVDILYAIKVLKENNLSVKSIGLSNIYQTAHHYKLDCYEITKRDHKFLVQDLCSLFLNIIDEQEKELQNVLTMYCNLKYQKSFDKMIHRVEKVKPNNIEYMLKEGTEDYKENTLFSSSFLFVLYDQYLVGIIVILIILLIFLM